MNAMRTVMTDQVVAPSSHPSMRDQITSSIRPEAPDAAKRMPRPERVCRRPAAVTGVIAGVRTVGAAMGLDLFDKLVHDRWVERTTNGKWKHRVRTT